MMIIKGYHILFLAAFVLCNATIYSALRRSNALTAETRNALLKQQADFKSGRGTAKLSSGTVGIQSNGSVSEQKGLAAIPAATGIATSKKGK